MLTLATISRFVRDVIFLFNESRTSTEKPEGIN